MVAAPLEVVHTRVGSLYVHTCGLINTTPHSSTNLKRVGSWKNIQKDNHCNIYILREVFLRKISQWEISKHTSWRPVVSPANLNHPSILWAKSKNSKFWAVMHYAIASTIGPCNFSWERNAIKSNEMIKTNQKFCMINLCSSNCDTCSAFTIASANWHPGCPQGKDKQLPCTISQRYRWTKNTCKVPLAYSNSSGHVMATLSRLPLNNAFMITTSIAVCLPASVINCHNSTTGYVLGTWSSNPITKHFVSDFLGRSSIWHLFHSLRDHVFESWASLFHLCLAMYIQVNVPDCGYRSKTKSQQACLASARMKQNKTRHCDRAISLPQSSRCLMNENLHPCKT